MADGSDLEYTSDGLRDTASELGEQPDEQAIQASMQEETAVATHRVAEAIEQQNKYLEWIGDSLETIARSQGD